MKTLKTRVLIIGGGVTGAGLARDLALRGVPCLLAEKGDLNAGASGANHGLLHSGARYVGSDPATAVECRDESAVIKKIAPHCLEETGGLFVAVAGDDENYPADFPGLCQKSGIAFNSLEPSQARRLEPSLSKEVIAAFQVDDAAIDPFMLCLDNLAQARALGTRVLRNSRVVSFHSKANQIQSVEIMGPDHEKLTVQAEVVVNAAGAWAGLVAGLAGIKIEILYSKGTLLVSHGRIAQRVINRLRKASDADILVPGGTISLLGTTSVRIDYPDDCRPTTAEVDAIIGDAKAMIPDLETTRYIRAYAGVRPLVSGGPNSDDRQVSRGFSLLDHAQNGLENFVTITGGKLTTYRLMAEKTADLVCAKLGVKEPCQTRTAPLPPSSWGHWTQPGLAAKSWLSQKGAKEMLLCECEMVSLGTVEAVLKSLDQASGPSLLTDLSLRSRAGKGPCQGAFCGPRIISHLYDSGRIQDRQGLEQLRYFLERRWHGFAPVLWGAGLMQADLQEALHCGFFGLELDHDPDDPCGADET